MWTIAANVDSVVWNAKMNFIKVTKKVKRNRELD
jgi:hypothetical protein